MPRKRSPLPFKLTDVKRARKADPNARIEFDLTRRTMTLIPGEPNDGSTGNPWDEVLTNAENKKRSA